MFNCLTSLGIKLYFIEYYAGVMRIQTYTGFQLKSRKKQINICDVPEEIQHGFCQI